MNKVIIAALLTSLTNTVTAQIDDPVGDFNRHVIERWKGNYFQVGPYRVKGSPFFLGESFRGVLKYKGGQVVKDVAVLYNLQIQKAGKEVNNEVFNADNILEAFDIRLPEKLGGQTLSFKDASAYAGSKDTGYYNVLAEGSKVSFLKRYRLSLQPDPTNILSTNDKVFKQEFDYYLYLPASKEMKKIKLRKKDIVKALGDEPVLKNEETDFSKEAEVTVLIKQLNEAAR